MQLIEVCYFRSGLFYKYSGIGKASSNNKHILIYTSKISFHVFETHNNIMKDLTLLQYITILRM